MKIVLVEMYDVMTHKVVELGEMVAGIAVKVV
jgi:hypothetical protein